MHILCYELLLLHSEVAALWPTWTLWRAEFFLRCKRPVSHCFAISLTQKSKSSERESCLNQGVLLQNSSQLSEYTCGAGGSEEQAKAGAAGEPSQVMAESGVCCQPSRIHQVYQNTHSVWVCLSVCTLCFSVWSVCSNQNKVGHIKWKQHVKYNS